MRRSITRVVPLSQSFLHVGDACGAMYLCVGFSSSVETNHLANLTNHLSCRTNDLSNLTNHLANLTNHLANLTNHLSYMTKDKSNFVKIYK